ncbi:helix-turn-helix transcriptional regulator [Hymenobacter sp. ISL-91]|uniref:helix-turn-helix domain-containing protein n=1 Tax=Hymenobacter sp. ISL-91 TaxID=2819151 RepID=UPI001BE82ED1|nr:helix-turn-helix transcriptional regulator [Hymenobacter sp. ISL-91]MBT2559573.1 helix-turn-helix transcriptional regulator [Hymenobacter sp. ISL-91]
MPRLPSPDSLIARVRAWFGLTQAELALYLGSSPPLVRDLETGRRPLSAAVRTALLPLLLQLPPPETPAVPGPGTPLPPNAAELPDAADLDLRRRECLHRAGRLLAQADALATRAHVAARWAAARPALLPPENPADPAPDTPAAQALACALALAADPTDSARAADHARWLRGWLTQRAAPLPAAEVTRYHRLRAQAAGLQAEAEALATALLPAYLQTKP